MGDWFSDVYITAVSKSYSKIKVKNTTLSEQLKNSIGKLFIGNLDTHNTQIHDHSLVDGKYEMFHLEWIWGKEHFLVYLRLLLFVWLTVFGKRSNKYSDT